MPVNTYDHIFTKGPESALPGTFDEGKIRFTTDTGRLFVDGQNNRTEVSDFVKGMTEDEIKSQLAPLANKIYISSDTNKFMIYDSSVADNWINVAGHANEADEATHASTADYATNGGTATYATNAGTSTYATNAGTAAYVTNGVRSIATGTANGTINVNINGSTSDITIKGLGSAAYTASTAYIASSLKGANNGVAELDSAGKVPSSQLPSFVDDVKEYDSKTSFPATGEADKIYIAKDTDLCYRWSGTQYTEISPSLALGETSSTAYRGDRGKIAYDHSQSTHARTDATVVTSSNTNGNININGTETTVYTHPGSGTNPHGTTKTDLGLGNVANYDQSKAISSITRSGTTFTMTALDGTTSTFTQQDNDTKYAAGAGIALNSGTFSNSGVRSIASGTTNGTINVNTNGSTADIAIKGLGSAAYTASGDYVAISGSTMTGTLSVPTLYFIGSNDKNVGFIPSGDGTNIDIGWDWNNADGAGLALRSVDFPSQDSNQKGSFHIWARNATTTSNLSGFANGKLTWDGKRVVTSTNGSAVGDSSTPVYIDANGYATVVTDNGVRAIATGTANGTINVNTNGSTADVAVKGLGSNAYTSTSYLPTAGGTLTGRTVFNNVAMPVATGKITGMATGTTEIFKDGIAMSSAQAQYDLGWIRLLGTSENDTVLEIATGDDAISATSCETIVARQYNTSNEVQREAKLLDKSGNTSFPGSVSIGGGCTLQYNSTTQSLDFIFA